MAWDELRLHVVSDVDHYRALADALPQPMGVVIELGGATGETTALLAGRAQRVVVVEKGRQRAAMLTRRFAQTGHVTVIHGEAADLGPVQAVTDRADALFADLGGDAPAWPTMGVVQQYVRAFRPATVVVRNTELAHFVQSARAAGRDAAPFALGEATPDAFGSARKHEVRRAAETLAAIATPETASRLAGLLIDADLRTRRAAASGLLAIGVSSLGPLSELLGDPLADVRGRRTAAALTARIGAEATRSLCAMARSLSLALQWAGTRGLLRGGFGEALLESLAAGPGSRLAQCEESNSLLAIADTVALLIDGDEVIQWVLRRHLRKHQSRAARALGRFVLFSDGSPTRKAVALSALAALSPEDARRLSELATAKRSGDELRQALWDLAASAVALADEGDAEAIWGSIGSAWTGDPEPLQFARDLVGREPGDMPAREAFREAAGACGEHGCPAAAALLAGLRSPHARVRELTARALGWLAVMDAEGELRRLNRDPDPEVRRAAQSALRDLKRSGG
jgi:hypothetical protein